MLNQIVWGDSRSVVPFGMDVNGVPEAQKSFGGHFGVYQNGSVYGDYPANNFQVIGPVITTATAVLPVTGLHGIHSGQFKFTLTTETLLVEALGDSGTSIGPVLVEHVDNATPGLKLSATALVAGTYRLVSPFTAAGLKFTKSAAVNSINLEGFLSGAS